MIPQPLNSPHVKSYGTWKRVWTSKIATGMLINAIHSTLIVPYRDVSMLSPVIANMLRVFDAMF